MVRRGDWAGDSAGVDDFYVVIIFIPVVVIIIVITLVGNLSQLFLVVVIPHELHPLRLLGS